MSVRADCKIILILQPTHSDVKIGPVRAHENRLFEKKFFFEKPKQ